MWVKWTCWVSEQPLGDPGIVRSSFQSDGKFLLADVQQRVIGLDVEGNLIVGEGGNSQGRVVAHGAKLKEKT